MDVIDPREVPLGGPRAMTVRRTLPARGRALIGAWCFADHFGPDRVADTGGMYVPPHPHTGLQTVSWLFSGTIVHTDSVGSHQIVGPGSLSLMTAGAGIAHAEVSAPPDSTASRSAELHGVQLWVALPEAARTAAPAYQHHVPTPALVTGGRITVFIGQVMGTRSPVRTFSPLLGAEVLIDPGATVELTLDSTFEHGILVDTGMVLVGEERTELGGGRLGYRPPGGHALQLANPTDTPTRLILLGGTPFGESVIMWWNFMGRTGDEIARFRGQWNAEVQATAEHVQFGTVPGFAGEAVPAPTMPTTALLPRR